MGNEYKEPFLRLGYVNFTWFINIILSNVGSDMIGYNYNEIDI